MENKTGALPVEKINWRKRVLQGLIVLLIFAVGYKLNVVPIACAKVDDITSGNVTVSYNEEQLNSFSTISPDFTKMAYCSGKKEFFVRDMASGKTTRYLSEKAVGQVKYSPDGAWLVAGNNVLNVASGEANVLPTRAGAVNVALHDEVAFSADSRLVALVKTEKLTESIEIWDLEDRTLQQTLSVCDYYMKKYQIGASIHDMSFSRDGQYLAVAGRKITVWNLQSGQCVKELVNYYLPEDNGLPTWSQTEYSSLAYSPDGKHLAAALLSMYTKKGVSPPIDMQRSDLEIWDMETGSVEQTIPYNRKNIYRLRYSPDGKTLAVGESLGRFSEPGNKIAELVDVASGQVVNKMTGFPDFHIKDIGCSADCRNVFVGSDEYLKVWKIK